MGNDQIDQVGLRLIGHLASRPLSSPKSIHLPIAARATPDTRPLMTDTQ